MDSPLVSVLIPLYNHEHYIIQCLNSVLLDDYKNKEILITDDCSTDCSYSVVSKWLEQNNPPYPVSIKRNEPNLGICRTLNDLVRFSKGTYILPIASDDCLVAGSINTRLAYLENNKTKMAVFGDCFVIDEENNIIYNSSIEELHNANTKKLQNENDIKHQFIWNWSIVGPSTLINRNAYDEIGFYDEDLKIEDWDFYLRLASKNLIGFTRDKVGLYRIHQDNASRKKSFRKMDTEYELLKIAVKNLKNFKGYYKYLLFRKILVYFYLITQKLSPRL